MQYPIPSIGAKGVYTLNPPLDNLLKDVKYLECAGIRSFGEVINSGRDPFKHFYQPLELEERNYLDHARAGAHIVTLRSDAGLYYNIPSPYIKSFPIIGGVAYDVLALVINLGALPKTLDLDHIVAEVRDTIETSLGVVPDLRLVKVSDTDYVSSEDHERLEAARQTLVSATQTTNALLLESRSRVTDLETENQTMKDYIESLTP